MNKSDFDISRIGEALQSFSKRMNEVFKPVKETVELEHKEVVKINKQSHRAFINKKCR